MADIEIDLPEGPKGLRNYTEKELFESAKIKYWNVWNCDKISKSYRPTFLIRLHNLTFKRVVGKKNRKHSFQRQDLVINIRRGETELILGQPGHCEEHCSSDEEEDIYYEDNTNLMGDCFSPFVEPEHCQVCRDADSDEVYIKDKNTELGTFVNGNKLTPHIYHCLKNGDIVSLGISHLNQKVRLSEGKFWVFKFMGVSAKEENDRKELVSKVFGNSVILTNILSHMAKNKLWEWRLVSKFWNQLTIPLLREQSSMILCIGLQKLEHLIFSGRKKNVSLCIQDFQRKTETFQSLGLQKLNLQEIFHSNTSDNIILDDDGLKLLKNFFITCSNQILKVKLNFNCIVSEPKHKSKIKMIQTLFKKCEKLQEIEIFKVDLSDILEVGSFTSAIHKITVSHKQSNIENFLKLFPKLVELTFQDLSVLKSFLSFATDRNNEKFIKQALGCLKVLKIVLGIGPEIVKSMALIPIKIQEIYIKWVSLDPTSAAGLSNAISGFGKSVRKLTLGISYSSSVRAETEMLFPKMEKLEILHIYVSNARHGNFQNGWTFTYSPGTDNCAPNLKILKTEAEREVQSHCAECLLGDLLNRGGKKQFPKLEFATVTNYGVESPNYVYVLKDNVN